MTERSLRLEREREHARRILDSDESNWGWSTPAGRIRKKRREDFLATGGSADMVVLEIGCGSGTFTGGLVQAFPRLIAIDVADLLLDEARRRFPRADFRKMDAHHLEFDDASVDLILGCSVLHHLDWALALRDFHRVLRPGGSIRFSEPNLANPQIFLQKNWPWLKRRMGDSPDEYAFTAPRIRRDLEAAGFVDVVAQPYEFLHPAVPSAAIDRVIAVERLLERSPVRAIAGSLRIEARRP